jgi:hypothetical protein
VEEDAPTATTPNVRNVEQSVVKDRFWDAATRLRTPDCSGREPLTLLSPASSTAMHETFMIHPYQPFMEYIYSDLPEFDLNPTS